MSLRTTFSLTLGVAAVAAVVSCSEEDEAAQVRASATPAFSAPVPSASVSAEPAPPPWDGPARPELDVNGDDVPETMDEQRERLFKRIEAWYDPGPEAMQKLKGIFEASSILSQGNPKPTKYAMTRSECRKRRAEVTPKVEPDPRCGARNMVPLYDREAGETAADAKACIDQYEFPNIPCEYPVVFPRANEAHALCQAVGKRLCDAHEWEGACAGNLIPAEKEYAWGKERILMRNLHNANRKVTWAYGSKKNHAVCATHSRKSPDCAASSYEHCGSNTFPAGSYPECVSPLGVYDLHGNAAEHMSLPLEPEQLTSRGGTGYTEMKGSWFIFNSYEAHIDDCRWRAPGWHGGWVKSKDSHRNFHLGFRCCNTITAEK